MIKKFLSYVEITTKITSVFAFLMTAAFLYYNKQPITFRLTIVFFIAMFMFDLTTTAINNYIDTKTNCQQLQFERKAALVVIFILLAVSVFFGLYLVYLTDFVVLIMGGLCFLCGILYTYGPVPISRQPFGEFYSGLFYGFFIPFIMLYINMPEGTYFTVIANFDRIDISLWVTPLISVALLSVVPFCATANIMLANNICDLEKDIAVKRFTLPYYLGGKSLQLFAALYYLAYVGVAVMVMLRVLHPLCLLFLPTIFFVQRNINIFTKKQEKSTTFIVSVKNYIIIMGTLSFLIFLSGLF